VTGGVIDHDNMMGTQRLACPIHGAGDEVSGYRLSTDATWGVVRRPAVFPLHIGEATRQNRLATSVDNSDSL